MKNNKFKEGTVIKGKDLKGYILCKILSEDMIMRDFQYKLGMNEDVNPLALNGSCEAGLYFCLAQDIHKFFCYGTKLAIISVGENEDVYVGEDRFRTHRLNIEEVFSLDEPAVWKYLMEHEEDITACGNHAVRWASENGYLKLVRYFVKNGADVTACDNYALQMASRNGHLEVVKCLVENGADITACDDYALQMASENGYLEVVKYLVEHGANITANENYAVKVATKKKHTEIAKYLCSNMKQMI